MDTLMNLQETLENQWAEAGYQRYIQSYQQSPFSKTHVGHFIMGKAYMDLKEALRQHRDNLKGPRTFFQKAIFFCLTPEEVAIVTLQYMLDFSFKHITQGGDPAKACFSSMVIGIANRLCDMFNWKATMAAAPAYTEYFTSLMKDCHRIQRLRMVKDLENKALEGKILKLPTADKIPIGYAVAKLAIESTGIFVLIKGHSRKSGHSVTLVTPEPSVIKSMTEKIDSMAWAFPLYMPMVCPPKPWTSALNGGYLTLPTKIIGHSTKNAKALWDQGFLQSRAEVLNHIQSVPFVIDQGILASATEAYHLGHRACPANDMNVSIPPKPWQTSAERELLRMYKPDVFVEYTSTVAKIHREYFNSHTIGKRIQFLRTLSIARKFQQYESIWFPWNMDYRGRFYPLPTGLSPQGDDLGKALLRFAKEEPWHPSAWDSLKIHGAGLMGIDKVPFSERIAFIDKHHEEILKVADDFLSTSWWELADKPWRMLQWCREYAGLYRGTRTTTGIPVDLDGSCNGLQHLSMAMRDTQTAKLVNLLPSDKPSDIYTDVQRMVEQLLPEDSPWKGKVTRKLVKRNVMTTPYNVTRIGMGDQIRDEMQKNADSGMLTKHERSIVGELRDTNYQAIQLLLGKSAELMRWYSDVSRYYMDHGLRVRWDLPDGFRALQDIPKYVHKEVQLEGRTISISYREETSTQDSRRNTNALAPNVTHSMDATHMAAWIRNLMINHPDTPFVCVHDSFGLPVTKLRDIGESILRTFVDLYESFDVIESIRNDFRQQTGGLELPPPPDRGDLDLALVRQATYPFA